ncbi:gliding motility lipoprotein GldH [Bacteroidia bacterium]|nr:gliding motility lipoprotein GldH [Bacteroidia bacterium]MDB4107079.1 gliding motility lipoprotein GldH [Bacteroidia bacterium]MDB9882617.1 gliding motility lipoprotein GldH [Bacteroidia bacterium]MDC1395115.1 gliding motility lipoprotein GldH [Bacteroidia bacterium]
MTKHILIFSFIALFAVACNQNVMVDRYHDIPENGWQYEHIVTDSFEISEPGYYHLISANLRITGDYPYANIHLKVDITSPDGKTTKHKVPVELAEKSGKWLGSGLGDIVTFQTPIFHRKFLNQKGKYTFEITQDMRLETLPSVVAAGIRVEQQEEIF